MSSYDQVVYYSIHRGKKRLRAFVITTDRLFNYTIAYEVLSVVVNCCQFSSSYLLSKRQK